SGLPGPGCEADKHLALGCTYLAFSLKACQSRFLLEILDPVSLKAHPLLRRREADLEVWFHRGLFHFGNDHRSLALRLLPVGGYIWSNGWYLQRDQLLRLVQPSCSQCSPFLSIRYA